MTLRRCPWLGLVATLTAILVGPTVMAEWTAECAAQGCIEGPAIFDCCFPDGSCREVDGTLACYTGDPGGSSTCMGDGDGDGIDDGCGCSTLSTACCHPDGSCLGPLPPGECEALGGVPFGGPCATCETVSCPVAECIGATGSCFEPNSTPGCEILACCDQVCSSMPECCESAAPAISTTAAGILAVVLLVGATLVIKLRS